MPELHELIGIAAPDVNFWNGGRDTAALFSIPRRKKHRKETAHWSVKSVVVSEVSSSAGSGCQAVPGEKMRGGLTRWRCVGRGVVGCVCLCVCEETRGVAPFVHWSSRLIITVRLRVEAGVTLSDSGLAEGTEKV